MNILIFVIAFAIPIAIMFVGMAHSNLEIVKSGLTLLLFFYCAFIGTCIKEIKKLSISKSRLALVIALFCFSIILIVLGGILNFLTFSSIIAGVAGIIAIVILLKSNNEIKKISSQD